MPATRSRLQRLSDVPLLPNSTNNSWGVILGISMNISPKTLPKVKAGFKFTIFMELDHQSRSNPLKSMEVALLFVVFFFRISTTIASVAFNSALHFSSHASPWAGRFLYDLVGGILVYKHHLNIPMAQLQCGLSNLI